MKISLLLVAGNNKRFIAAAIEAANAAFPGSSVVSVASLGEALKLAANAPELLALAGADESTLGEALQAVDAQGLPRWAVVAMGNSAQLPFAEVLSEEEWRPGPLARAFRGAVALNLLHRDRERLRGDLLSVGVRITHDLRTPVGGILSATEVLDVTTSGSSRPDKALLQPIFDSANDLVRIISHLAVVSKASGKPTSSQRFNMGGPVSRALERVEMKLREKGAVVSKPKAWPDAVGDPSYTEAVWVGLLENAIRHSGKTPTIDIGWEQSGDEIKFWVNDGGPGVPQQKRKLLFQPFHRLHEPSAARGLGLPVIERLVRLQGGDCGYSPRSPSGASFHFTLPG